MTTNLSGRVQREIDLLPAPLVQEVLDFIGYLVHRHGLDKTADDPLKAAQELSMRKVWDNPDDEVWNAL
ncbi:MAG: DUF2281 domain-containing protein [Magnetococcus sp. MYC-9]